MISQVNRERDETRNAPLTLLYFCRTKGVNPHSWSKVVITIDFILVRIIYFLKAKSESLNFRIETPEVERLMYQTRQLIRTHRAAWWWISTPTQSPDPPDEYEDVRDEDYRREEQRSAVVLSDQFIALELPDFIWVFLHPLKSVTRNERNRLLWITVKTPSLDAPGITPKIFLGMGTTWQEKGGLYTLTKLCWIIQGKKINIKEFLG